MSPKRAPTVRQIAEFSGVHFTTVSKILRGQSRAAKETQERVLKTARQMGYQPNPLVSAWMAQRRSANPARVQVNLGFISLKRSNIKGNRFGQKLRKTLHARAEEHGYAANEFFLEDYDSLEQLARILHTRNIKGIVWAGVVYHDALPKLLKDCAMCSFGGEIKDVAAVRTDPFHGMQLVLEQIKKKGIHRPALILCKRPTNWNLVRYEAAFRQAHSEKQFRGRPLVYLLKHDLNWDDTVSKLIGADAVITNLGVTAKSMTTVHLDARPGKQMGIDQRRGQMAQVALDQVASRIISPVLNAEDQPPDLYVAPRWVDAE